MNRIASLAALALVAAVASAQPLTTAFTFQGRLDNTGAPANGAYDLRFTLFSAQTGGTQLGPQLCVDNVSVTNGLVTVQLDFGSQFAGNQRFLEVQARQDTGLTCSNGTGFTTLSPRQNLTASPDSLFSLSAATAATATNATSLNNQPASFYTNAANLTGLLPAASFSGIYNAPVTLSNTGNSLSGNGAGLTQLNAASLASGTLPDARLSTNVPLLGTSNTFTGANMFTGFAGVNRSSPLTASEVFGLQNASGQTSYAGMYIRSTDNAGGRPFYGYNVNGRSAWTYYDIAGSWQLHCGGVDAMTVTNSADVGIGTATPAARLDVNGAIRSSGGIVFPDGSTQYRADNTLGTPLVTSGLPGGSTFVVTVNGTTATLASPYEVNRPLALSGGQYLVSGSYNFNGLANPRFRRPRTADAAWANWTTSGTTLPVTMVLTVSGATVTWSANFSIASLQLVSSGGVVYEELALYPQGGVNISRIVSGSPTVGAPSTDTPGVTFTYNGAPVANAVGFGSTGSLDAPIDPGTGFIAGARDGATVQVRSNCFAGAVLRANFIGGPFQSGAIVSSGVAWRSAPRCLVYRYTLRVADDGLPVEEYQIQLDPP